MLVTGLSACLLFGCSNSEHEVCYEYSVGKVQDWVRDNPGEMKSRHPTFVGGRLNEDHLKEMVEFDEKLNALSKYYYDECIAKESGS